MHQSIRLFGLFVGVLLANVTLAEEARTLYKWTDDQGNIAYQDTPPPAHASKIEEKRLRLQKNIVESSTTLPSTSSTRQQGSPTPSRPSLSREVAAGAVAEASPPQPPNPLPPRESLAPVAPPALLAPPPPLAPPAPTLPPGSAGGF